MCHPHPEIPQMYNQTKSQPSIIKNYLPSIPHLLTPDHPWCWHLHQRSQSLRMSPESRLLSPMARIVLRNNDCHNIVSSCTYPGATFPGRKNKFGRHRPEDWRNIGKLRTHWYLCECRETELVLSSRWVTAYRGKSLSSLMELIDWIIKMSSLQKVGYYDAENGYVIFRWCKMLNI